MKSLAQEVFGLLLIENSVGKRRMRCACQFIEDRQ